MAGYIKSNAYKDNNLSGIVQHANTVSFNVVIQDNYNGMSAGPITIDSGVSVTVPTGSTWTIV